MSNEELDKLMTEACNIQPTMMKAAKYVGIPYTSFKVKAVKLGIWKPNQGAKGILKPINEVLKSKKIRSAILKDRLYYEGIKKPICEKCGQLDEWNGEKLVLELDHINGDKTDNRLENLRIMCPNCHSQTPTFRNRSRKTLDERIDDIERSKKERKVRKKKDKQIYYCSCGNIKKTKESKYCTVCDKKNSRKVERPPYKQLVDEINELGYCGVGRKYNVSDNSIRKWKKQYEK